MKRAKNEREKGEEHFAVFDIHSACLAHVWSFGDANLYAAAPELLEALEDICNIYEFNSASMDRARAAIKKARGQ